MLIEEMASQESLDLLARTRLGRLACARGQQPYVVPIYYAYKDYYLYSFTTVGQKIEWMRQNPLVCVEVDEVTNTEEWLSVIVFGRYEELPDTPDRRSEREFAWTLLQKHAVWWEPALARRVIDGPESPRIPIFYRISALQITGHRAVIDPVNWAEAPPPGKKSVESGWLRKLARLFPGG